MKVSSLAPTELLAEESGKIPLKGESLPFSNLIAYQIDAQHHHKTRRHAHGRPAATATAVDAGAWRGHGS